MKFKDFLKFGAVAPLVAPALPFIGAAALLKNDDKPAPAPAPAAPAPAPVYNITIINNGDKSQIGLDDPKPGTPASPASPAAPGTSPGLTNSGDPASPAAPAGAAATATGGLDLKDILGQLGKLLGVLTDLLAKLQAQQPPAAAPTAGKAA
jgi:hypothetical protein